MVHSPHKWTVSHGTNKAGPTKNSFQFVITGSNIILHVKVHTRYLKIDLEIYCT